MSGRKEAWAGRRGMSFRVGPCEGIAGSARQDNLENIRACINEHLFLLKCENIFFARFDLHLTGRKVNNQAGVLNLNSKKNEKNEFNNKSFGTFFALGAI